ncbi:hypothetical protein C900_01789 [Fulvivirga imtechensis AK7]|uniref:Uncharacterized protein n=1 Tax=Fulvivirga imtechensis AK7 TaxID=1237149 RepID=L8JTY9_9BACT|nr:hypothetical protein C900_01789 [Fulvivirga imtechensis AK7]
MNTPKSIFLPLQDVIPGDYINRNPFHQPVCLSYQLSIDMVIYLKSNSFG